MPIKQILSSLLLRLLLQLFKVCVLATECVVLIEKLVIGWAARQAHVPSIQVVGEYEVKLTISYV